MWEIKTNYMIVTQDLVYIIIKPGKRNSKFSQNGRFSQNVKFGQNGKFSQNVT